MIHKALREKIKIFLTDQWRSRSKIGHMSRQVMLTVADFYHQPEKAEGYREWYGLNVRHTMGLDSGGFQFLMGKMKGVPMEPLPCGIEVPVNSQKTIDLYKRTGIEKKDLPIQLDLPPRFDLPPADRRQLIERSSRYYYEMLPEIPGLVPVIHGWTLKEIEYNLSLIEDPDLVAAGTKKTRNGFISAGTNAGARFNWTMGNMNPHKWAIGLGSFGAPSKSVVDFVNPHKIRAVGSFKGLTTVDYSEYAVSRGRPKMRGVATPVPGAVDLGTDKPIMDKIVSTPVPTRVDAGMAEPDNMAQVGAPSKKEQKKTMKKKVPYDVILKRLIMVSDRLCEDYEVFFLGGASPHMTHQLFMLGGKWTDTSAWRIKGLLGEIYIPGKSERGIGYSYKTRRCDDDDRRIIREHLQNPNNPLCGMSLNRFLEIGRMLMPEWYETWPKNKWEIKPFELRCFWNAYVLKFYEEPIANELSQDPDRYYKYLRKRLEDDNHPVLVKRLDKLAEWGGFKRSGQTKLEIFMRGQE